MGICGKCSWVGVNCDNEAFYVGGPEFDEDGNYTESWFGGPDPEKLDPNRGGLQSHGTKVAGMITAGTNNTIGIAACAPNILVLPIRLNMTWDDELEVYYIETGSVFKAYKALLEEFRPYQWTEDVRVVNMSYGSPRYRGSQQNIIEFDQVKWDRLYVGIAHNYQSNMLIYPAAYDEVLGVSGLIYNFYTSSWLSSIGDENNRFGSNYRIEANPYSTYPVSGIYGYSILEETEFDGLGAALAPPSTNPNYNLYENFNGTSASAPQVAALAALLFTAHPERTHAQVESHIIATRDDSMLPGLDPNEPIAGLVDFDEALSTW